MRLAISIAAAFSVAAAQILVPRDLPDGFYGGNGTKHAETGMADFEYLGPHTSIDEFKLSTLKRRASAYKATRQAPPLISCNGRDAGSAGVASGDAASGLKALEENFAGLIDGLTPSGSFVFIVSGDSVTYACIYGGVFQTLSGASFLADMAGIDASCGETRSGWSSHLPASTHVDYGRDHTGWQICATGVGEIIAGPP